MTLTAPAPGTSRGSTARMTRFGGLRIGYDDRVPAPRPWTLAQPLWLADLARDAPAGPVLELFCGAGHLGLVLAQESRRWAVLVDDDPVACGHARANAVAAGLHVGVRHASVEAAVRDGERFALVLAAPARTHDDDLAGRAVAVAERHLVPGGHAVLQLGDREQLDRFWAATAPLHRDLELCAVVDLRPGGVLAHLRRRGVAPAVGGGLRVRPTDTAEDQYARASRPGPR